MSRNTPPPPPPDRFDELSQQIASYAARLEELHLRLDAQKQNSTATIQRHRLKLDVPRFDGTDAHGWIFKICQFFTYHETPKEERITIASFYLDGPALSWYQWMYRNSQLVSWNQFLQALETRFAPTAYDDPRGNLFKLTQSTTVAAYLVEFEALANRIVGLSSADLLSCFISGLKLDIRREVLARQPTSLTQAAGLARLQEDKLLDQQRANRPKFTPPPPRYSSDSSITRPSPGLLPTPPAKPRFRHLSEPELAERREKGLCFNCDQKWSRNHNCRARIFLMVADEDDVTPTDQELEAIVTTPESSNNDDSPSAQLSLHALSGHQASDTFKVTGKIATHTVDILVDGGSTHNFIQEHIATALGLTHSSITPLRVMVGSGQELICSHICLGVQLAIQGHAFPLDLYVLGLRGADVVLGAQWLKQLGPVLMDYNNLTMKFFHNNACVELKGDPASFPSPLSLHQLQKVLHSNNGAQFFSLRAYEPEASPTTPQSPPTPEINLLIEQFSTLFSEPTQLPPARITDHAIPLQPNSSPDGSWRMCVDYRALNALTVRDRFPLPTIDELLDELGNARIFSKLDLTSGFHQIRLMPEDTHKTAFRTHDGHYEYCVMPFGLCNAPATFQATMNDIFRPMLRKTVIVFFDDILVFSTSWDQHLEHLKQVFTILSEQQFHLKASKCSFGQSKVSYLGHIVEGGTVAPDPLKIQAVDDWPTPNQAMGAVLLQGDHPIAYFSKLFCPRMTRASTYLRELHAITGAVKRWRQYLLGQFFIIQTDHRSLKELLTQVIQTPEQQFYLSKLLGYHYDIQYKPGKSNTVADALSRAFEGVDATLHILSLPQFLFLDELRQDLSSDPAYIELRAKIESTPHQFPEFTLRDALILRHNKIWVSPTSRFKRLLMKEFHETPVGGHGGIVKTLKRLSENFYWANMRTDVKEFINCCVVCQQTKYSTAKPGGLLQPLPIPSNIWEDISLDFVTGLPLSHGYTVILVVVDRFSKAVHLGALPTQFTAYRVAELFVNLVCKLHGLPKSIVSDRDPIFISRFWADLFRFSGTLLRMSSSYHPQTDGQTEVTNRTIEQYLRSFVHARPSQWFRFLPWAEFHYNTSFHSAAGMTPYQVIYGKIPPTIPSYIEGSSSVNACDDMLNSREEILALLRRNLAKAQARMKANADSHRREVSFEVGSWVYVKLQPYRQISVTGEKYSKLSKRFYGPFVVLERIGEVAYKLELPSHSKIHNVFHCSVLKQHQGPDPSEIDPLPFDSVDNHPLVEPLAIINSKTVTSAGVSKRQVLVQWTGLSPDDTSWEDWDNLEKSTSTESNKIDEAGPANTKPKRITKPPVKHKDYVRYK
ncbi:unnamed protein product [Trifolium pratense]|uniref:Uncharacterized protein n=1 Tax=Trifolium pratense TaxID=57577 RepID=A0ACB0IFG4_TRIPR|nr:unnamed protein product [Trifolium pratense]